MSRLGFPLPPVCDGATNIQLRCSVCVIFLPFVQKRCVSVPSGISESFFGFDHEERRSRETFELMLHVTPYLIFDDGI